MIRQPGVRKTRYLGHVTGHTIPSGVNGAGRETLALVAVEALSLIVRCIVLHIFVRVVTSHTTQLSFGCLIATAVPESFRLRQPRFVRIGWPCRRRPMALTAQINERDTGETARMDYGLITALRLHGTDMVAPRPVAILARNARIEPLAGRRSTTRPRSGCVAVEAALKFFCLQCSTQVVAQVGTR